MKAKINNTSNGSPTRINNTLYMEACRADINGDQRTASRMWRILAERGKADAQHELGFRYKLGRGVKKNYKESAKWYRQSAKLGNVEAQVQLGLLYSQGKGVRKNSAQAVKWFRLAAEQGHGFAQLILDVIIPPTRHDR